MDKRELMLKQIDATLEKENEYLEKFNRQLSNPNIVGSVRENIVLFRDSCIDAIRRHKKIRLLIYIKKQEKH